MVLSICYNIYMNKHRLKLLGRRFGKLVVIQSAGSNGYKSMWKCRCDCGEITTTQGVYLKRGATRSCGCISGQNNFQHGKIKSPEYKTWGAMKSRCHNKNHDAWHNYGGRGIYVCDRWRFSFKQFLKDMGRRPEGKTLDRRDNNGPYAPWNCRWVTRKLQARNSRKNLIITYKGQSLCLKDAAKKFGIKRTTLGRRIHAGWSIRDALTRPVRAIGGVT